MTRLGLEIPTVAKALRAKQEQLKANYNTLQVYLDHIWSWVYHS